MNPLLEKLSNYVVHHGATRSRARFPAHKKGEVSMNLTSSMIDGTLAMGGLIAGLISLIWSLKVMEPTSQEKAYAYREASSRNKAA